LAKIDVLSIRKIFAGDRSDHGRLLKLRGAGLGAISVGRESARARFNEFNKAPVESQLDNVRERRVAGQIFPC